MATPLSVYDVIQNVRRACEEHEAKPTPVLLMCQDGASFVDPSVICVFSLSYYLVCSLQTCCHL